MCCMQVCVCENWFRRVRCRCKGYNNIRNEPKVPKEEKKNTGKQNFSMRDKRRAYNILLYERKTHAKITNCKWRCFNTQNINGSDETLEGWGARAIAAGSSFSIPNNNNINICTYATQYIIIRYNILQI